MAIQQHALMVTSDFEVVQTVLKVEWKFATINLLLFMHSFLLSLL